MKILIINLRIWTGSVGRIVSDLYFGSVAAGHQCKIAYARGSTGGIPVQDTFRICGENEVRLHAALTRLFGNTAFYSKGSTRRFCKWISEYDPDIIHIHGAYGYYLNLEILFSYCSRSRAIVISTLHSCWDFTGHCCYFDFSGCQEWKTGCKKCKQKSSYPASSFLDNTKNNFIKKKAAYDSLKKCIIVTPSKWLASLANESFLRTKIIMVINNGVDIDAFSPRNTVSKYIDNSKPSILCLANIWENRKGWNDVVELSKLCGDQFQLIVVGVRDNQKKELSGNTVAITHLDSKESLAELYSSATVFFNPTYEDNYPTVNLEAAACHTPIVTYKTGGSPEVFLLGNWGITIDCKDYKELFLYCRKVFDGSLQIDFSNSMVLSNSLMIKKYIELYEHADELVKKVSD